VYLNDKPKTKQSKNEINNIAMAQSNREMKNANK